MLSEVELRAGLVELIRWINAKGWSPGTSTNYSYKHLSEEGVVVISKSGVDKAFFTEYDLMEVDMNGDALGLFSKLKPSAETLIHTTLYKLFPETGVILHTHSKAATLMSQLHFIDGKVEFSGYEVLKGLPGINTHYAKVELPIFANDQDMARFSDLLITNKEKLNSSAFLMQKHGIYVWGPTLPDAKRHLEIYEYLLDLELTLKAIN